MLIDTGAGDKETEKFYDIYGIENSPIGGVGPTQLESALAQAGFSAGRRDPRDQHPPPLRSRGRQHTKGENGAAVASFPNARYVVRKGE